MIHSLFVGSGRALLAKRFEIELGEKVVLIERENPQLPGAIDQVLIRYDKQSRSVRFRGDPPGNALEEEVERAALNAGCWAKGIGPAGQE